MRTIKLITMLLLIFVMVSCAQPTPVPEQEEPISAEPTEVSPEEEPAGGPAVDENTIVVASVDVPSTLDPEHDVQDQVGVASVHATLVEYVYVETPDGWYTIDKSYEVQPMLAEKWEVSSDGKEYTFFLRKGVKSRYGNELDVDDVLYTFDRHFAVQAMGLVNTGLWSLTSSDQLEKIDDYTFKITIPEPRPFVLQDLAIGHLAILDSDEVENHATSEDPWAEEWVANHDSGFGAYWLEELTPGQQMVLIANPDWYEGPLPHEKVIYKAVPEAANRFQLLLSGDVDIALKLSPRQLEDIRTDSNLKVIDVDPSNLYIYLFWNNGQEPFNDVKVREALSYAIPYEDIVNTIFYGYSKIGKSPLTSLNPDQDISAWNYNTDLEKATQLLAEAGYPDGFSSEVYVNIAEPATVDIAVLIANAFKQIGVDLEVKKVPEGVYGEGKNSKEWPMLVEKNYSIVDTAAFALPLFWGPGSLLNWADYGADGYGEYPFWENIQAALNSTDVEFQKQVWKEAQQNIIERAGAGFVVDLPDQYAMKKGLQNFHWHPDTYLRFRFLGW